MKLKQLVAIAALSTIPLGANAWDIKDILNRAGNAMGNTSEQASEASSALGNLIGGIFQKSNLKVSDLTGTWTVTAPAVSFQSENFLQKAGGTAAAAVIENKLAPYYQRYGLTGATLTIDSKGAFKLKVNKLTLSGTITVQKEEKGRKETSANFRFQFNGLGGTSSTGVDTYVSKGLNDMKVMFDATRLQEIMGAVASFSKMQLAGTVSDMLNQYDGICIGFALTPSSSVRK